MSTLRELKGRIGSVASSEKITGAMKMISSAKMHKAEQNLSRLVPFRNQLQGIMGNLMQTDAEYTSELTDVRDVKTVTIVVLGSDEGLCGAYNINIFKGLLRHINELRKANPSVMINVVPVGKKIVKDPLLSPATVFRLSASKPVRNRASTASAVLWTLLKPTMSAARPTA